MTETHLPDDALRLIERWAARERLSVDNAALILVWRGIEQIETAQALQALATLLEDPELARRVRNYLAHSTRSGQSLQKVFAAYNAEDDEVRGDPLTPEAVDERRRRVLEAALEKGHRPWTAEEVDRRGLGGGGPWESDAEFDAYIARTQGDPEV